MAELDELPQLYKELRLLRLKYEHLADVCRSLLKNWPNRNSDGRLVKAASKKTAATGRELVTEQVMPIEEPPQPSELQLLEGILSKVQKIRISEEEQRKISVKKKASVAAESCKMAANVYQPSKQRVKSGRGNPLPQHRRPLTKTSAKTTKDMRVTRQPSVSKAVPHFKPAVSAKSDRGKNRHSQERNDGGAVSVRVERHTGQGDWTEKHVESVSVSRPESVKVVVTRQPAQVCGNQETDHLEDGRSFNVLQDRSKLRMPSKYYTLHSSLARIQDYIISQRGDPTREAVRAHFIQRLIPKEVETPVRAIQLQLAREEYQLLTEELEAISPQEWAVSDKSQCQDVLKLKVKLDQLLGRATALREEVMVEPQLEGGIAGVGVVHGAGVGVACGAGVGVACGAGAAAQPERPLVYSSLDQWLQVVELEHTLNMQRLDKAILEFCTGTLLPQLRERRERMSIQCLQMLSELAGQPKPIFISNQLST